MKSFPCTVGMYFRIAEYPLDRVLPYVVSGEALTQIRKSGVRKGSGEYIKLTERSYDGEMVKMTSQRYQLFASKGVECVGCGLAGAYFALERNRHEDFGRFHFNLYGLRDGAEVLMTKDHIVPKSKGGKNTLDNYQVMCFDCNAFKADSLK